jgi:urease accessory protein
MAMNASLHIQVAQRRENSFLQKAFFTPPFKLADITEDRSSGPVRLMIMSSSPGVLDGDVYDIRIELSCGAMLQLDTQSYQRLFHMKGSASQTISVYMGEGASLTYLPHPVVPHSESSFTTATKIFLAKNCSLAWGEVITSGRKLNGESFLFSKFHSTTEIFLEGKLVVKENLLLLPHLHDLSVLGQLEGFSHQASLIFMNREMPGDLLSVVAAFLDQQEKIMYGCTYLQSPGVFIRLLGSSAEQLHGLLQSTTQLMSRQLQTPVPHAS